MFQRIVETSAYVQSFAIQENIYLLSDRRIQVFDGRSHEKIAEKGLFEKEGSARSFIMDGDYIYCKDFVHLYVLARASLDVVARLQLGTDLSSDICGMALDEGYVYLGIRNGAVARVEKPAWEHVEYYPLSASSMWTIECDRGTIYAGNVDGQLLAIDAASMEVEKRAQAHRQNLKSLCILGHGLARQGPGVVGQAHAGTDRGQEKRPQKGVCDRRGLEGVSADGEFRLWGDQGVG